MALEARGAREVWNTPRAKPVLGVECSYAMQRQWDSFIAKPEGSP